MGALLVNTLVLIACSTVLCAIIGTSAAWFVERTNLPGKRLWAVLAVVPLAIPPFITSYAWVSLDPNLEDFAGALLVVTVSYYPLVYLPVAAALREMDPALEETARGARQQCIPGVSAGGAARSFGRPCWAECCWWRWMFWWSSAPLRCCGSGPLPRRFIQPTGPAFPVPSRPCWRWFCWLLCVACLSAEYLVRGKARYGRLAHGTRRKAARYGLGRWRILPPLGFGAMAFVTLGVPLGMIAYWLSQPTDAATTAVAYSMGAGSAGGLGIGAPWGVWGDFDDASGAASGCPGGAVIAAGW